MSSSYAKILEKEIADLREILDKMVIQKNDLIANNSDGKYDQIISKLSSDIDKLNSIIKMPLIIIFAYLFFCFFSMSYISYC